ncbi:hypothetical protein PNOK_0500900 [Pyrrhoderma noxium]|uniref:Uncharacterized protein n=1 Tax=Pyrrhoderma noxium TaxID=2282107 RepID=A0A286UKU4_9AGAM|nr:hypothetical protein PNOK_0500900 [Pyrrhoderma noxium]
MVHILPAQLSSHSSSEIRKNSDTGIYYFQFGSVDVSQRQCLFIREMCNNTKFLETFNKLLHIFYDKAYVEPTIDNNRS